MDIGLSAVAGVLTVIILGCALKAVFRGDIIQFLLIITVIGCCYAFLAPFCGYLDGVRQLWAWLHQQDLQNAFFQGLDKLQASIRQLFC